MSSKTYIETFDSGPNGWLGWESQIGPKRLEIRDGAAISQSPWWVDYNHAPPGGGHLHLLYVLHTARGPGMSPAVMAASGPNAYVDGGFPTDLTNAKITLRLKGEMQLRGAQLCLLAQGNVAASPAPPNMVNQVLVGQPVRMTREWSEQTIQLVPDQSQWLNLGSRHDRQDFYGKAPISELLRKVNGDIIFVLCPLDVRPLHPIAGDLQKLRAGEDYEVDRAFLPAGQVMLDEVRIEFPS